MITPCSDCLVAEFPAGAGRVAGARGSEAASHRTMDHLLQNHWLCRATHLESALLLQRRPQHGGESRHQHRHYFGGGGSNSGGAHPSPETPRGAPVLILAT